MKLTRILPMVLLLLMVARCTPSTNHFSESFSYYQAHKAWGINATTGQTLHVEFNTTVSKGSLVLQVLSPSGMVLWTAQGEPSGTQTKDISITKAGKYTLNFRATAAYGSYDLKFALK